MYPLAHCTDLMRVRLSGLGCLYDINCQLSRTDPIPVHHRIAHRNQKWGRLDINRPSLMWGLDLCQYVSVSICLRLQHLTQLCCCRPDLYTWLPTDLYTLHSHTHLPTNKKYSVLLVTRTRFLLCYSAYGYILTKCLNCHPLTLCGPLLASPESDVSGIYLVYLNERAFWFNQI